MAETSYVISKALVENGMIISFEYRKQSGERKPYTVIVVDKGFDDKMHALSTTEISPHSLGGSLGVISSKRMKEARGLDIPLIQNMLESGITTGYRTFILQNIDKVFVIKWPFDKNIWDVTTPLDIPKSAIDAQKDIDYAETGNEAALQQPDDIIVQQLKQKLQQNFTEGEDNEN